VIVRGYLIESSWGERQNLRGSGGLREYSEVPVVMTRDREAEEEESKGLLQ
jgi:hypothetical protein